MAQRKIALVIGYGQSNEAGHSCKFGDTLSTTNPINRVPSFSGSPNYQNPSGSQTTWGMFHVLADLIGKRKGHSVIIENYAVDGTGIIGPSTATAWAGFSGAVTTGTPLKYNNGAPDAGYDPNSRIANTVAGVIALNAAGYEVWVIMQGGQSDNGSWTAAQEAAALIEMMGRVSTAGASRIFYGVTPRQVSVAGWNAGEFFQLTKTAVASGMAANPKFMLGADLSNMNNTGNTPDANMFPSADAVHANDIGTLWGAKQWYDLMNNAAII